MKKHLFIVISILLSLASCSHNPKEEAEKVVKEYISALQDGNMEKVSALTYNGGANEKGRVIEDVFESEITDSALMAIKGISIDPVCVINKDSQINVEKISDFYVGGLFGIDDGYVVSVRVSEKLKRHKPFFRCIC